MSLAISLWAFSLNGKTPALQVGVRSSTLRLSTNFDSTQNHDDDKLFSVAGAETCDSRKAGMCCSISKFYLTCVLCAMACKGRHEAT